VTTVLTFVLTGATWSMFAASGEVVQLTAAEPAGVARAAEPVTSGVPFPQGLVKDAAQLALVDARGEPVPAVFSAINLWPKDQSVRWALVDTQVTVPAGGVAKFGVIQGAPAAPAGALTVADAAETITVDTGRLKFAVRKKGFRLFESVALDGRALCAACPEGLAMTIAGVRYTSAADAQSQVVVEEQNAMRVALLATGKLASADGAGKDRYDYRVRIHAYAGSPVVKVVATVIKKFGAGKDVTHFIGDLSLGLKLARAAGATYALGGDGAPAAGALAPDQKAGVLVKSSARWEFTGQAKGSGDPKAKKPLTLGWGGVSGPDGGVAAAVYRFWQVWPKAIEVAGDGTLAVGLYPQSLGQPLQFFTGMARTHEVLLVFHGKDAKAEDVQAKFAAFQKPLFAAAPPAWYCSARTLGSYAPVGAALVKGATEEFRKFDQTMSGYFDQLMGPELDNWQRRGVTMDAYGWLAYGDTLHWVWLKEDGADDPEGSPWKIAWDANYYDLPHLACAYFARTGERKFLEYHLDHAWHLMDIDTVHWDPGFPQGGASRRCPATNHVGYDPPDHREPIINVAFDHHKSESIFERYYLTGDRFARETALELLGHAFRAKDANYENGERRPAHQILTLVAGYWCTGEAKYLERARQVIQVGIDRQAQFGGHYNPRGGFTDGITVESFCKYYQATQDEAVFKAIKSECDWRLARGGAGTNWTFGFALAWKKTGEQKYLDQALTCLRADKTNHLSKDMGHMYRTAPNATGLLLETPRPVE
jgi:hypothetical protein